MQLWAGRVLIFVAITHLVLAFALLGLGQAGTGPEPLLGVLNFPWQPHGVERQAAFWSTLGSFAGPQLLWGLWVVAAARRGQLLPAKSGVGLLVLTALQVTVAPFGGFWLNLIPAVLLMAAELSPARTRSTVGRAP